MLAIGFVILVVGAVYCSGYEALTTGIDNWPASLVWAAYALLPWYLLFEWIRRREHHDRARLSAAAITSLLIAVGMASLLAEQIDYRLASANPPPILLSLLRRTPGIAVTVALIIVSRIVASSRFARPDKSRANGAELVNWPAIRWIAAADNYLEVHYPGRVAMVRMTMREAQRTLESSGFVRIHRSTIVNRAVVEGVEDGERGPEVQLDDGQRLPAGKAFAANLRSLG